MDFKQIQELIKLVNKTNVSEVKIEDNGFKITIRSKSYTEAINQPTTVPMVQPMTVASAPIQASAPPATEKPPASANESAAAEATAGAETSKLIEVKAPMIGTFYRSSSPDKPPFIKVGDSISEGNVLCIIEAMKLFNEIESEMNGTIVKILVENATPVEYDTPLFLVQPNA